MLGHLVEFTKRKDTLAIGLVFMLLSFNFATWVSRIPYVKEFHDLNEKELGILLFFLPVGLIIMNTLSGYLIQRLGQNNVLVTSLFILPLTNVVVLKAPWLWTVALGLVFAGLVDAIVNVAMNATAANLGKKIAQEILSTCHGLWSLGSFIGAFVGGWVIGQRWGIDVHLMINALFCWGGLVLILPLLWLMPEEESTAVRGPGLVRPTPYMVVMIVVGIFIAISEGTAFDWSSIYLRDYLDVPPGLSTLGFGLFAGMMAGTRFLGDFIIQRLSSRDILAGGCIIGAIGLIQMVVFQSPWSGLLGFMLLGTGVSLGAPVLYRLSMNLEGVPSATGLATFNTLSFLGFMLGPVLIGFISEETSLHHAIAIVGISLIISALLSRRL